MVYFKKYDPRIALNTSMGSRVPFIDLGTSWGLLSTEDNYLISELRRAQREQRGGVMEISGEEFEDLKKKETPKPRRIWREQVAHQQVRRLFARVNQNAAAEHRLPPGHTRGPEVRTLVRPTPVSGIVVKSCRR
jgi:hypothetical protein